MFVLSDTSVEFKATEARLKVVATRLFEGLQPTSSDIKLSATQTVFPSDKHKGKLYLLKEGVVSYSLSGSVLFHFEAGEIIGLDHLVSRASGTIATDFAVIVDEYSGDALLALAQTKTENTLLLAEYLALQGQLLAHVCQSFLKKSAEAAPEIRAIASGDDIILEGTVAKEVFTLVEGAAEAIVDGIAVGQVLPGELFGVVAALTGTLRKATVRATKNSTVLVIDKDNFSQLIESRPATVLKMVEEMAHTLINSESELKQVSLSRF